MSRTSHKPSMPCTRIDMLAGSSKSCCYHGLHEMHEIGGACEPSTHVFIPCT